MAASSFRYNPTAGRYFSATTGRFVSPATVNAGLQQTLASGAREVNALTRQLAEGTLDIASWQTQMGAALKQSKLAAAALARGGVDQMTQADFGRVGQQCRVGYEALQNFAQQLANGDIPLDGRVPRRAELYVTDANGMYDRQMRAVMAERGMTEARNVLSASESCDGCIAASDLGWTAVENIPPVGSRDCVSRCRCVLEFREVA